MESIKLELEKLNVEGNNIRLHGEKQINELIKSLDMFGQTRLIVLDENYNVLIGKGLYLAMKKRGDKFAYCYIVKNLTENQKKKLMLSDNKLYEMGSQNFDEVEKMLNDLALDNDFEIAGYDSDILKQISEINTKTLEEVGKEIVSEEIELKPSTKNNEQIYKEENNYHNIPENTQHNNIDNNDFNKNEQFKNRRTIVCPNCGEVIYLNE